MKRLQQKGLGSKRRQAEPLTEEEEEILWSKGLLGDHSPQALLNTMVFMNSLHFALRSGREHRELQFSPCQIDVVDHEGEHPYLLYTEDTSKKHPVSRVARKCVKHHVNLENPTRCFVHPESQKHNAFYLKPLVKPTQACLYS